MNIKLIIGVLILLIIFGGEKIPYRLTCGIIIGLVISQMVNKVEGFDGKDIMKDIIDREITSIDQLNDRLSEEEDCDSIGLGRGRWAFHMSDSNLSRPKYLRKLEREINEACGFDGEEMETSRGAEPVKKTGTKNIPEHAHHQVHGGVTAPDEAPWNNLFNLFKRK